MSTKVHAAIVDLDNVIRRAIRAALTENGFALEPDGQLPYSARQTIAAYVRESLTTARIVVSVRDDATVGSAVEFARADPERRIVATRNDFSMLSVEDAVGLYIRSEERYSGTLLQAIQAFRDQDPANRDLLIALTRKCAEETTSRWCENDREVGLAQAGTARLLRLLQVQTPERGLLF